MAHENIPEAPSAAETGLITQRMIVERGRGIAVLYFSASAFCLLGTAGSAMRGAEDWWYWPRLVLGIAVGTFLIAKGITELRARSKQVAQFNARHGEEAGRQE
jgi:cyanate permease